MTKNMKRNTHILWALRGIAIILYSLLVTILITSDGSIWSAIILIIATFGLGLAFRRS